jgi:Helix-turn-helix domain of resolvase
MATRVASKRKLLAPRVTGSPIYYRTSRGGCWRLDEFDLLYLLDMYAEGEPIKVICKELGITPYRLYRNLEPYLQRR